MIILSTLLAIICLIGLVLGYFTAYVHGVILASKAGAGWVVACLLFGLLSVLASLIYVFTKKNIFQVINRKVK